jgi:parallel beta-helix repeat protein
MRGHNLMRGYLLLIAVTLVVLPDNAYSAVLTVGSVGEARFKTIAAAMAEAEAGDTVIVNTGVYRETIRPIPGVTIEGRPGAVIKGSDIVTGWEAVGEGRFVKRPWSENSQQVFIDGVLQAQIGGAIAYPPDKWKGRIAGDQNSMPVGSFYYDETANALYLRPADPNLAGKTVEVSVRPQLVHAYGVDRYTLKNLVFTHSNSTALGQAGALRLLGHDITIDNIKVIDCDGAGLTIRGDNNVIKNSVFSRCGQFGVAGSGRNVKWFNNEITHNNTRGFYKEWGAGGMKFMGASPLGGVSGLHDSEFVGNRVLFNKGDGIWFDTDNRNNLIANNIVAYNQGSGIHYEISYSGVIRNNYIFGNTQRGIYVSNSADTIVEHNLVVANGMEGIYAQNAPKRAEKYPARNNKVTRNIIAWSGKHAIRLPDADYNNFSDKNLIVDASPRYGVWDDSNNPTVTSLAAWQQRFAQDDNSWERVLKIPEELGSKLKNQQTNMDWTVLTRLASAVDSVASEGRPGPQK